jgi:hypothetical protein
MGAFPAAPERQRRAGNPRAAGALYALPASVGHFLYTHGIGASPARGVERRVRLSAIPKDLIPVQMAVALHYFDPAFS